MYEEHKRAMLKHVLWMAERDPEYAIWAAGEAERQMPWLLKNLQKLVEREVKRCASCYPCAPTALSTPASTGPSAPAERKPTAKRRSGP